jgi:hypothetical protein
MTCAILIYMKKTTSPHQLGNTIKLAVMFLLAWLAVAGIYVLIGHPIALALLLVNLPILFVPALLELVTKTKLPIALQINFYIFLTAATFLGSIVGFYGSVPNWDTYVHLYSGVLTGWFGLYVVSHGESHTKAQFPKWFALIASLAVPLAIAALWEVYEYFSDIILNTNMQVGGLDDTMIDTISALIGALIAIAIALWFKAPKSVLPKSLRKV